MITITMTAITTAGGGVISPSSGGTLGVNLTQYTVPGGVGPVVPAVEGAQAKNSNLSGVSLLTIKYGTGVNEVLTQGSVSGTGFSAFTPPVISLGVGSGVKVLNTQGCSSNATMYSEFSLPLIGYGVGAGALNSGVPTGAVLNYSQPVGAVNSSRRYVGPGLGGIMLSAMLPGIAIATSGTGASLSQGLSSKNSSTLYTFWGG